MMGRYELLRALKGGGMAEVFLGRRRGPGGVEKQLVVKRIRRQYARDPRFIRLFLSEARLSMTLTHKNIVPVFDFGRAGDDLFFVMEYVDGMDLARALDQAAERPLPAILAAFVAMEVCQALDYAHRVREQRGPSGVVHRDVTPRNVLLSYAGEVKLADFGVATLTDAAESAGSVRGTPAYMSPEQAHGREVDGRSDLFSLGLVLWEMLCGSRAYPDSDAKGQLARAKRADVPALADDVAPELADIVARATAAEPDDRFADATEMQRALDRFVVSRRAEDGDLAPPNQMLSSWLGELFPHPVKAAGKPARETPVGSVVTFLDDGEQGIAQMVDDDGTLRSVAETMEGDDGGTLRSMAETMAEAEAAATRDNSVESAAPAKSNESEELVDPADPEPPSRTGIYVLLAVVAAGLITTGVWLSPGAGSLAPRVAPQQAIALSQPDAGPVVRAIVDIDAAPPPSDAAATTIVDARTKQVVVRRPVRRPRRRVTDARVAQPPGKLHVSTSPWAKVEVLGTKHRCADTPCALELPPGTYTVKLTNPVANVGKTVQVVITSGQTRRIRETLTRPL